MTGTKHKPPPFLEKIFQCILSAQDREALCGDFEEIHNDIFAQKGRARARLWYFRQILSCLPRYIAHLVIWRIVMLVKTLQFAFRKLRRLQLTSGINIAGLAIGLAFFSLLVAFVRDELNFDRFHEKADRIYIMTSQFRDRFLGGTHHFIAEMLESEYPEVQSTLRLAMNNKPIRWQNRTTVKDIVFSDPEFFDFFTFPLSGGSPDQVLADPYRMVITSSMARSFFGSSDPLGKTLSVLLRGEYRDFIVSGVIDKIPKNSSLQFDCILPYVHVFDAVEIDPNNNDFVTLPLFTSTLLELPDDRSAKALRSKLPNFSNRLYGDMWRRANMDLPKQGLDLLKLSDFHLGDVGSSVFSARSRPVYSFILSGIALLVLLLACFNSVNLSLAHSSNRFTEIGVRKVIGARKEQLFGQLLTESLLSGCASLVLGFLMASFLILPFSSLTGKDLELSALFHPQTLLIVILAVLMISLITGIYPARSFSHFPASELFRGRFRIRQRGFFSKIMIVFQFGISLVFITGTLVMVRQLRFMSDVNLGYEKEGIIIVNMQTHPERPEEGMNLLRIFRNELQSDPRVLAVSGDSGTVGMRFGGVTLRLDKDGVEYIVESFLIDAQYRETLGIPLIGGRDLSLDRPIDTLGVALVNETLVREFELVDPVGKRFSDFSTNKLPAEFYTFDPEIVGVIRDFHLHSLHVPIGPMVFSLRSFMPVECFTNILVKVKPGEETTVLKSLEEIWKRLRPELPFSHMFLDDALKRDYERERSWGLIVGYSAGFALFIACMGLFGLAAVNVIRRTKETGIRKVLGATPADVLLLFSKDLLKWVAVSNLLSWPIAFAAAKEWLNSFAYRIEIGIWTFMATGVLTLLIAGLAISWHILKAVFADPVRALRYE
jgi:putative ABC transport system permease protein